MHTTIALLGFVATALAAPQAPASGTTAPSGSAPAGCSPDYSGKFTFQPITVSKRATTADACSGSAVVVTLKGGVLTDSMNRQGDIVKNGVNTQFQFDPAPGQAGYLYNAGFSVCQNTSIALGPTTVFYSCASGSFSNIYYTVNQELLDSNQCQPIGLQMLPCDSTTSASVTQASDGQPAATSIAPAKTQPDGQPTGTPVSPATQISDGQPQAGSAVPVSQISDGQLQMTAAMPVSQISDGQIQATGAPVPVSQIGDGQIQATSAAPVSQISDGQVQATATKAPVSQISDGQIQATSAATVSPVTQIGDGQIQAHNGTSATSTPVPFTGSASNLKIGSQLAAIVLGAVAVAFL